MTAPKRITDELHVTVQPRKGEIRRFAEQGFRTIINNRPDGEEAGQLSAAEARAEAEQAGLKYVHLPVKASAIAPDDVEAFRSALETNPKPVITHCRTGTRSYLLWGAGQALHGARSPQEIVRQAHTDGYDIPSLPDLVAKLRGSR